MCNIIFLLNDFLKKCIIFLYPFGIFCFLFQDKKNARYDGEQLSKVYGDNSVNISVASTSMLAPISETFRQFELFTNTLNHWRAEEKSKPRHIIDR